MWARELLGAKSLIHLGSLQLSLREVGVHRVSLLLVEMIHTLFDQDLGLQDEVWPKLRQDLLEHETPGLIREQDLFWNDFTRLMQR